uniref:Phosphatidic acid phosphatase type 2/haloperoxidase domain-containing protein n=1 Tax=Vombatus ursinus TaxID=29139 RepID=A0A4X2ME17_VOMUR
MRKVLYFSTDQKSSLGEEQLTSPVLVSNTYMTVIYKELSAFLFVVTMNQSLTSMAKIFTGRLRPNFLAVCHPDLAYLKCTTGYITYHNSSPLADPLAPRCTKSFFSDHAAFSEYCAIYLLLYLQAHLVWEWSKWLRLTLQTILLPLPLLVGYLKIQDYWQHPLDILVGLLQGLIIAIWVVGPIPREMGDTRVPRVVRHPPSQSLTLSPPDGPP